MNNIGEQINSIINSISNKLGIAVEKLYPALKLQAKIDGFESLIWLLIGIVMIIVAIYLANKIVKWMRSEKYDEYDDAERVMLSWGGVAVLVLIGGIFVAVTLNNAITAFLNPDWYVIQKILKQLK